MAGHFYFFEPVGGSRLRWEFGCESRDRRGKIASDDVKVTAYAKRDRPRQESGGSIRIRTVKSAEVSKATILNDEGSDGMLIGGDGAVGVWEGRLQMGEHFGLSGLRIAGKIRRRTLCPEDGANLGLAAVEALPDALQGAVAQPAGGVSGVDRSDDAVRGGILQELPESAGRQFDLADFVGKPDAMCESAAGASVAVAAEDALGALDVFAGVALVVANYRAVAIEGADLLAVGAGSLFELFRDGIPFHFVAVKPRLLQGEASAKEKEKFYHCGAG